MYKEFGAKIIGLIGLTLKTLLSRIWVSTMKKSIIFAISFILLFSLFQVLYGMFLTFKYTPDTAEAWNLSANLPQEIIIKSSHSTSFLTLFFVFISAAIAYFIQKRITKFR